MQKSMLLSCALLFGILAGCTDSAPNDLGGVITPIGIEIGKPAPDFTLPDSTGKMIHLSDYRGKVVYVDFWASWCAPCRLLFPSQKELWGSYRDKDFAIIGVSYDSNRQMWKDTIITYQLDWIHTIDDGQSPSGAQQLYGVEAIPQSVLVDKDGIVVAKNIHGDALRDSVELYVNR